MFVSLYTKNDPVIFLSKDQADMLLSFNKEDSVDFNYGDKNNTSFSISELEKSRGGLWSLQHEYRHTQRNFTSNNNDLYRFIDEACTNVSSYNDLISVLTFLGYTTDDLSYSKIKEAYESDDENKIKDVLDIFQKNFGDIGVMLVGSQPSSYASSKDLVTAGGNGNLPILSSKEYSFIPQQCRFFEKLLELRKQKDSNWAKKITEKIGSEKISIQELENQRFAMHQFFIAAGFPNVSAFNKILEEEIKKRSSRS